MVFDADASAQLVEKACSDGTKGVLLGMGLAPTIVVLSVEQKEKFDSVTNLYTLNP